MKKIFKTICVLLSLPTFLSNIVVFAEVIPATVDTDSVNPYGRFTVTVNLNGGSGTVYFSGDNAKVSVGSVFCEQICQVPVTAGSSGVAKVTVSPGEKGTQDEVTDKNDKVYNESVTLTVRINNTSGGNTSHVPNTPNDNQQNIDSHKGDSEQRSEENLLASLSLSTGSLNPQFSPDVMEYQVVLKAGTTSTSISAQAKDAKATIQGTGDKELVEGDNVFDIKVIAENGAERIYKIHIYVEEKNLSIMKFDKLKYGVVTKVDRVQAPNGFEKSVFKLDGKDVPIWHHPHMKLSLLYLRGEDGKSNFYIFDEKKKEIVSVYQPIQLAGKDFVQLSIVRDKQKRSGMKFSSKIKIGDLVLPGWEYENQDYQNYVLLYLMNHEGKANYYLYEKTEGTIQIAADMASISQAKYDELESSVSSLNVWKTVGIVGTVGFALLAGIGFYLNSMNKKRYLIHRKEMYELDQIDDE